MFFFYPLSGMLKLNWLLLWLPNLTPSLLDGPTFVVSSLIKAWFSCRGVFTVFYSNIRGVGSTCFTLQYSNMAMNNSSIFISSGFPYFQGPFVKDVPLPTLDFQSTRPRRQTPSQRSGRGPGGCCGESHTGKGWSWNVRRTQEGWLSRKNGYPPGPEFFWSDPSLFWSAHVSFIAKGQKTNILVRASFRCMTFLMFSDLCHLLPLDTEGDLPRKCWPQSTLSGWRFGSNDAAASPVSFSPDFMATCDLLGAGFSFF